MAQALFSATYLAIVAAAGMAGGVRHAWLMAAITAALAFFAEEFAAAVRFGMPGARLLSIGFAILSWVTGVLAGLALLV